MKPLTKILVIIVVVVALIGIARIIIDPPPKPKPEPATPQKNPINISIITALPVEQWVTRASEIYNSEEHYVKGRKELVEVIPMDGLSALNKWARGEFNPVPTVWLAESRTWVDQANIAALKRTGQDIFLAGGRYRAQPVVLSPLVWGIWRDAYNSLSNHMGTKEISWDELHEAAKTSQWVNMGGETNHGKFKLIVADCKRDPAGLTAMVGAAGAFFNKPIVTSKELRDPHFLDWLKTLLDTVVDFSPFGVENMFLFGRSNGDVGQIVESHLLVNMEGLEKRWKQPLRILYPDPIAWFDFPYAIYMGKETSAEEKQAALNFKNYLISAGQQAAALNFGLRPATAESSSTGGLVSKWKGIGVMETIPSASRMRAASRSGLHFLSEWCDEQYGK